MALKQIINLSQKGKRKTFRKKAKAENKILYSKTTKKNRRTPVKSIGTAIFLLGNCQRQDYVRTELYQLMKYTCYSELLPELYFKGLYNKDEVPENFQFRYALLSQPDEDGYDKQNIFSAVFDTGWNS